MVGIICSPPPGWDRVTVAAKTWWGPVPMPPDVPVYEKDSKLYLSLDAQLEIQNQILNGL